MTQCRHCGANLPDEARFCLQCGTPVEPPTRINPTPQPALDFVQPALAGGMFLGFLSSIPLISAGNVLCCMWVLLGGAMAAVLLRKQRPTGITYGDGAFVGVLSGLFGAIIGTVIQLSFRAIAARFFESQQQQLEETLRQFGFEGPTRDLMVRIFSGEISVETVLLIFFSNLVMFSLFAMIGGILALAILNRREAQAGPQRRP